MYLFFDTETTGLSPYQDRLVQIAWILADRDGQERSVQSYIVRPDGFNIPYQASQVHGITTDRALREGHPLQVVLERFCSDLEKASMVICHNLAFDRGFVMAECARARLQPCFDRLGTACTMQLTTDWCQLPKPSGYPGYKWPKLEELHFRLFNCHFDSAHDALADAKATRNCFFELLNRRVIVVS